MAFDNFREYDKKHLHAAMLWLSRAQFSGGGFSAAYSSFGGWAPPYPETTGYIIDTLLRYANSDTTYDWHAMACKAGKWLISIQLQDGGYPGGDHTLENPIVFNTGMILFGMASLYQATLQDCYKLSGLKALQWLADNQKKDGSWTRFSSGNIPHAYHSNVAWGMLKMAKTTDTLGEFLPFIERANDWVLMQQDSSGWYNQNDLIKGLPPLTHNIAYVVQGLLECGAQLNRTDWFASAEKAAQAVYDDWVKNGKLRAGYRSGWEVGPSYFRCVTGDAQFGIIWFRLWELTGNEYWLKAAKGIAAQVVKTQSVNHILPGVRGGIPGAWPVWGRYLRFKYPNWAAKFFADLMINLLDY